MTDPALDLSIADPTTEPFWRACHQRKLAVQRCSACGAHQFYPRPFCLGCDSDRLEWVETKGTGVVYSMTTVRVPVTPELDPPYVVALVDLDDGPRILTNIVSESITIGDRVTLAWRERGALPPLPVFRLLRMNVGAAL